MTNKGTPPLMVIAVPGLNTDAHITSSTIAKIGLMVT
jgi:hypothetical protein